MTATAFQNCDSLDSPSGAAGFASLDTTPPDLVVGKAPSAVTASPNATFEFASTDSGAGFECSFNAGAYISCASPLNYLGLPDGNYQLAVRAKDAAGNLSMVLDLGWRVDRLALTATISSSVPAFTNIRNYSINFTGSLVGSSIAGFECKVDALAFAACSPPYVVTNLTEGNHTVQVRSKDSVGTYSAPASLTWRIDLSNPAVAFASGPDGAVALSNTPAAAASFGFLATDTGGSQIKSITCKLDGGAETACGSPVTYQIDGDGVNHAVVVKLTDNAGNTASATRNFSYTSYYDAPPGGGGGDGN